MNSLNSVLVEGNLTRDPELRATPNGTSVCGFGIASNRYYRREEEFQQEVSFFEVETWWRLAEVCAGKLEKGRGVRVVGRLKQDRWQDQEGNPRSKVKIVAEHVEFKPIFKGKDKPDSASDMESPEDSLLENSLGGLGEAEEEKVLETV